MEGKVNSPTKRHKLSQQYHIYSVRFDHDWNLPFFFFLYVFVPFTCTSTLLLGFTNIPNCFSTTSKKLAVIVYSTVSFTQFRVIVIATV